MADAPTFSNKQKLQAVLRELGWRHKVYPGRVEAGRMKPEQAKYQLDIFEAIAADLKVKVAEDEAAAQREKDKGDLFGGAP